MARCELVWRTSFSASCIHAADAAAAGRQLLEPRLAATLVAPAQALRDDIRSAGLPEGRFWRHLNALAWQLDANRELAAAALRKTAGGAAESLVSRISGRIGDLETTVQKAIPQLVEELALRQRPLRELWDAYGPGLLLGIARRTDDQLLVDRADLVLVLPVLGGGGAAHLSNNSVRLEAVLTNNIPQLPEIVRLGWLLSQLQLDLPRFSEPIHPDRLPLVAALAMLPATLQSAADLELCRGDSDSLACTISAAISAWRVADPSAAEIVQAWWETFLAAPTSWTTALAALDQMLSRELPGTLAVAI